MKLDPKTLEAMGFDRITIYGDGCVCAYADEYLFSFSSKVIPALPLKCSGTIDHINTITPTQYAIDANGECWSNFRPGDSHGPLYHSNKEDIVLMVGQDEALQNEIRTLLNIPVSVSSKYNGLSLEEVAQINWIVANMKTTDIWRLVAFRIRNEPPSVGWNKAAVSCIEAAADLFDKQSTLIDKMKSIIARHRKNIPPDEDYVSLYSNLPKKSWWGNVKGYLTGGV